MEALKLLGIQKEAKDQAEYERLIFSVAEAVSPNRERAECALIYRQKPPTNDECKDAFPYEKTTVKSSGKCKFITPEFTVEKTP